MATSWKLPVDSDMFEKSCSYKVRAGVPLVRDVFGMPKAQYVKFIHTPQFLDEPARFFGPTWMEIFTRTPWYVIPIVWMPVIATIMYFAFTAYGANALYAPLLVPLGMLNWTLIEYTLHRAVFHLDEWVPDHPIAIGTHFLLHGVHHLLPQDSMRLVFPPIAAAPLAAIFYVILRAVYSPLAYGNFLVLYAGAMLGYVCYDLFHYFSHHGTPSKATAVGRYIADLKTYHMKHHYVNYHLGYGISSKLWDYAFGTVLRWEVRPAGAKAAATATAAAPSGDGALRRRAH